LRLLGRPDATIVTWASSEPAIDIYAVADQMVLRGWPVDRQQSPPSVHLTVNAANLPVVDIYLADLAACVDEVRKNPGLRKEGEAAVYGLMAKIPVRGLVEHEVLKVMEKMYGPDGGEGPVQAEEGMVKDLIDRYGDRAFGFIEQARGQVRGLRKMFSSLGRLRPGGFRKRKP
jgi:sphinganine-1-phosphate aldolase